MGIGEDDKKVDTARFKYQFLIFSIGYLSMIFISSMVAYKSNLTLITDQQINN